ncbi:MAG: hypothetical protein CBE49_003175 [Rickettsiales bacterium TMED289]|nr:MAG: hypothetical protein CBE49_003175 [Rickettsiales bacterium TMED289]|tara:strand:- start:1193 stop:3406 length:2214 start_codon:yes stop_codon:yes gene_type:complete
MLKKIYTSFVIFLLIILFLIFYLSAFGFKTNKFNNTIYDSLNKRFQNITIDLGDIYLKLKPFDLNLLINTKNSVVKHDNKNIKLKNLDIQIPLVSFIIKKNRIDNIKILSEKNNINEVIDLARVFKNNFQITLINKLIKSGEIEFNANLSFDDNGKLKENYLISSNIYNLKFDLLNKKNFNTDFKLVIKKNLFNIKKAKLEHNNLIFNLDDVEIDNYKKNKYKIKGNIKNDYLKIKLNQIFEILDFKVDNIINEEIEFSSENTFSFEINNKFKILDFKSNTLSKIKSIEYEIEEKNTKSILDIDKNLIFSDHNISIDFQGNPLRSIPSNHLSIEGSGSFTNGTIKDKFQYNFVKHNETNELQGIVNAKNNSLNINIINYFKPKNEDFLLKFKLYKQKNLPYILRNFNIQNLSNQISGENLTFSNQYKFNSLDKLNINFVNNRQIKNNLNIRRLENKNYEILGETFDASEIIDIMMSSGDNNSILENFNDGIKININKFYFDKNLFVNNLEGNLKFKNNKIYKSSINSKFSNNENLILKIDTKDEKQFTQMYTNYPEPLIKRYKFIKGFKEGTLDYQSTKINNKSESILIIDNFKVKEVPVLAKILTLASLQGIADLLTGEGIRFTDFEMKYKKNKNLTEINEIYAIGPAISLMMSGYIEKDKVVSLRGTLVPATTINRTISSIPVLGDILVGKKVGEGVFGVSFKIKGHPDNLKTTVNPIKTLTPRFITRTLEKIKN